MFDYQRVTRKNRGHKKQKKTYPPFSIAMFDYLRVMKTFRRVSWPPTSLSSPQGTASSATRRTGTPSSILGLPKHWPLVRVSMRWKTYFNYKYVFLWTHVKSSELIIFKKRHIYVCSEDMENLISGPFGITWILTSHFLLIKWREWSHPGAIPHHRRSWRSYHPSWVRPIS